MSDVLVIKQRDESPVAEEIAWDIEICANTLAELSEAWARLRKVVAQLNDPEHAYVLPLVGAEGDYARGLADLQDGVRGLSAFLGIQEAYLSRIQAPQIVPTAHEIVEAVTTRANGSAPVVDELPPAMRIIQTAPHQSPVTTWVNRVSYGPSILRSDSRASVTYSSWVTKITYGPQLALASFQAETQKGAGTEQ